MEPSSGHRPTAVQDLPWELLKRIFKTSSESEPLADMARAKFIGRLGAVSTTFRQISRAMVWRLTPGPTTPIEFPCKFDEDGHVIVTGNRRDFASANNYNSLLSGSVPLGTAYINTQKVKDFIIPDVRTVFLYLTGTCITHNPKNLESIFQKNPEGLTYECTLVVMGDEPSRILSVDASPYFTLASYHPLPMLRYFRGRALEGSDYARSLTQWHLPERRGFFFYSSVKPVLEYAVLECAALRELHCISMNLNMFEMRFPAIEVLAFEDIPRFNTSDRSLEQILARPLVALAFGCQHQRSTELHVENYRRRILFFLRQMAVSCPNVRVFRSRACRRQGCLNNVLAYLSEIEVQAAAIVGHDVLGF